MAGLHTEYSQILSRGGQRNETIDKEAAKLIPGNLSPSELSTVVNYIKSEGQNVLSAKENTITDIQKRFGGGSSTNSSSDTTSPDIKSYVASLPLGNTQPAQSNSSGGLWGSIKNWWNSH